MPSTASPAVECRPPCRTPVERLAQASASRVEPFWTSLCIGSDGTIDLPPGSGGLVTAGPMPRHGRDMAGMTHELERSKARETKEET